MPDDLQQIIAEALAANDGEPRVGRYERTVAAAIADRIEAAGLFADAFEAGARAALDAIDGDASHATIENAHEATRGCPCGSSHAAPRAGGRIIPDTFAQGILGAFAQQSPIVQLVEQQQVNPNPCAIGIHHWAYLTGGGQACAVCGTRR